MRKRLSINDGLQMCRFSIKRVFSWGVDRSATVRDRRGGIMSAQPLPRVWSKSLRLK